VFLSFFGGYTHVRRFLTAKPPWRPIIRRIEGRKTKLSTRTAQIYSFLTTWPSNSKVFSNFLNERRQKVRTTVQFTFYLVVKKTLRRFPKKQRTFATKRGRKSEKTPTFFLKRRSFSLFSQLNLVLCMLLSVISTCCWGTTTKMIRKRMHQNPMSKFQPLTTNSSTEIPHARARNTRALQRFSTFCFHNLHKLAYSTLYINKMQGY